MILACNTMSQFQAAFPSQRAFSLTATSSLLSSRQTLQQYAATKQKEIERLQAEQKSLQSADNTFNAVYVAQANKLAHLRQMVDSVQRLARPTSSPRSDDALAILEALERDVFTIEQQIYSLVPIIGNPDTKSKLAVLSGRCDELQAKRVDAVQARGLSNQEVILIRRRSLVKRLEILSNLARTLHRIADGR